MTVHGECDGVEIVWSEENKRWEYLDGEPCLNGGKEICGKCGKPRVEDGRRFVLDKMNW